MVITKRGKKRSDKTRMEDLLAHEQLIGFAVNVLGIDPDEYSRMWGIETGLQDDRKRRGQDTHSKSYVARIMYFVYSATVFNAWVRANVMMRDVTGITTEDSLINQQRLNDVIKCHLQFLECARLGSGTR